jgi:hypothetical protein
MAGRSKLLTESGWRSAARDVKVRDKELRRALADYQGVEEDDHDLRIESIARISLVAGALKKDREVSALPGLSAYLSKLIAAAQTEEREALKAKTGAEKVAAVRARSDAGDEESEEDDEDDDAEEYPLQLTKALDRLKTAKKPFHVAVCLARPYCIVSFAKTRITGKRLKRLSVIAGGSKRFLPPGTCTREGKELVFELKNAPRGLALHLMRSIKHFTGKRWRVTVGNESAEDEEESQVAVGTESSSGDSSTAEAGGQLTLAKTPEIWNVTRRTVRTRVGQLKAAVLAAFAGEGTDVVKKIEQGMKSLDRVFERLDDDLADILERAAASQGPERGAELQRARALLAQHVSFVKSDEMITYIDSNPFGVKTDLQGTLTKSLRFVIQAIGK